MLHKVHNEESLEESSIATLRPEMSIEIHKEEKCSSFIHWDLMLHHGG